MTTYRHQSWLRQRVETPPPQEPIVQPDSYYDLQRVQRVPMRMATTHFVLVYALVAAILLVGSWNVLRMASMTFTAGN
jgi:hypothetical protein